MNRLESGISCPTKPDLSSQPSTPIRRWVQRAIMIAMTLAPISAQAEEVTAKKPETNRSVGTLVIAGGGEYDEPIRNAFLDALPRTKENTPVVLIPSAREDEDIHDEFTKSHWLNRSGIQMKVVHTRNPKEAESNDFAEKLSGAEGVWFSGGNQEHLRVLTDTLTAKKIQGILESGGIVGGTSAGASIMSQKAIMGGNPKARMEKGLGIMKPVIDQHFGRPGRKDRLLGAIQQFEDRQGIGIDEDTALVIRGGETAEVIGAGTVSVFSPDGSSLILKPGDRVNFTNGRITHLTPTNASEIQPVSVSENTKR